MSDCLFCKIIAGEIPGDILYEDDRVIAFKDINPQAPAHALIMPKEHIPTLMDLDDRDCHLIGYLHLKAREVAEKLEISQSGFRLICNFGKDGDQVVPHIHFHMLGGRRLSWPPG